MSEEDIDVSVVIPTHNRSEALSQTLRNFARQEFTDRWEVIVVNNNCTDDTNGVVSEWQKEFPVSLRLIGETVPGPAAARNAGAREARGKYLIFVDNDILTEPDFITRHRNRLRENPGCWIVGQFPNLPEQEATAFGRYRRHLEPSSISNGGLIEVDGITGQGSSLPKPDFDRLGGFDESFFVASGEDREFALRALDIGIRILFDPSIIAMHNDWAGTGIRDYCRRQRIYSQTEPIFAAKYGPRNPRGELSIRNSPINLLRDGPKLAISKLAKSVAGSNLGQAALIRICELIERLKPDSRILWWFYRASIAGAIFRGYKDGLSMMLELPVVRPVRNESAAS